MKTNGYGTYASKIDSIVKESAKEVDDSESGHAVEASENEAVVEVAD
jgi:hypothetical protein